MTRDRIYGDCEWLGHRFLLVDTGGIEPRADDVILSQMRAQANIAIATADVIVLVTDLRSGVVATDQDVANMLKKSGKPVILCVNKCDSVGAPDPEFYEFYNLGMGDPIAVSAVHGHGTGDLLDAVIAYFPPEREEEEEDDTIKVAVIGKPNVGKSSLINRISGQERAIVSDIAGTTRDATDTRIENQYGKFTFIDTAGIRRKSKVTDAIEKYSIIRARTAVERAGDVPAPACMPSTGKKVAIVGGGPSGLSCAYYLTLMGHKVTVYEEAKQLGGMLRYGIPNYRFPRHLLNAEIESILSLGIEVHTGVTVGKDIWIEDLQKEYDCLYIAIGAHQDKKTGIPGEDSVNVMSAVEMLRDIGDDIMPDFSGKKVVVIGGGNVAMDVTRSSIRLGAEKVTCVYRRRVEDMTALPDEVTGAMAEGAEIMTLAAPVRIEADEEGVAKALWVQPQIIGEVDKAGRPRPGNANLPEVRLEADIIVVAIGQGIEISGFDAAGVPIKRGTFVAGLSGQVGDMDNVFAGGDCVTGPATAIRAIAAGKVAAANIDEHLGYRHEITVDVEIPSPKLNNRAPHGRINTTEREAGQRRCDFEDIECGLTQEGAVTEASRCLRCDHFGYGIFRGGRDIKW